MTDRTFIKLTDSLQAWASGNFAEVLVNEIKYLPAGTLPLQACITQGSYADDSNIGISILRVSDDDSGIEVRIGVFFTEVNAGGSCGFEPSEDNSYCELLLKINKSTAEAWIDIIQ